MGKSDSSVGPHSLTSFTGSISVFSLASAETNSILFKEWRNYWTDISG